MKCFRDYCTCVKIHVRNPVARNTIPRGRPVNNVDVVANGC